MIFYQLLQKHLWVVSVIFVIFSAYLCANGLNMILRSKIDTAPKIDLAKRGSDLGVIAKPSIEEYNIVMERNVFNSASVMRETLSKIAEKIGIDINPGNLALLGTMAGPPEVSLALIANRGDGNKVDVYRIGESVGDYEVTSIERKLVRLLKDEKEEVLRMPEEGALAALLKPSLIETVADGIKKIGEGEMVVDKSVIDGSFENFGKLMRQARIMPHMSKDGQIDGFKVYRIKENSLYKKIGLEDGDIIQRVNGTEIKGPEDGLKLFEIFKTSRSISLDLERKGKKTTLSYSIR